jgi:hypothetical protein
VETYTEIIQRHQVLIATRNYHYNMWLRVLGLPIETVNESFRASFHLND